MQLISATLFILSLAMLVGAIGFLLAWHRTYRNSSFIHQLREGIVHIGVSAVVEYPKTTAPLVALLEEEYPRSEAVIVADLQLPQSPFCGLIGQYHLIRVNHSHLEGVRALYRSRHRAYRRVVVVDLPIERREQASTIGTRVASYDYILHLQGESIVERNAIAYCANTIASHRTIDAISLRSIVGCSAHLEKSEGKEEKDTLHLRTDHALAWRKRSISFALVAVLLPTAMVVVAYLSGSRLLLASAAMTTAAIGAFLYISCRVVTEKGLFARLDTILRNFYRLLVDKVKKYHYLYKGGEWREKALVKAIPLLRNREKPTNRRQI